MALVLLFWLCGIKCLFVVRWRYHFQMTRSCGILSSLSWSCSRMLLPSAAKPCAVSAGGVTAAQVRTNVRQHYHPNVYKRLKKHGLKRRLSSRNGIKILWRRYLKGKTSLSTWVNMTCTWNTYRQMNTVCDTRQLTCGHCSKVGELQKIIVP